MTSTDPGPPTAAKPKPEPAGTLYVILEERGGNDGYWVEADQRRARSATEAIRDTIAGGDTAAGRYVAIPERSFQPVRVKVETVQRIKLEDA